MIGYITLGTNDLPNAIAFYDALLSELNATKAFETPDLAAWQFGDSKTSLMVTKPYDGKAASVGNGVMIALAVSTPEEVDRLHGKALELGATDEGAAGPRGKSFYAGYFRDLDGNKLNFYCHVGGE